MAAQRRIVSREELEASLQALECPRARWMATELAALVVEHPHCAPATEGSPFRVLQTNAYDEFPALRLFYRFDDEVLYLLDVEVYDPLLPHG